MIKKRAICLLLSFVFTLSLMGCSNSSDSVSSSVPYSAPKSSSYKPNTITSSENTKQEKTAVEIDFDESITTNTIEFSITGGSIIDEVYPKNRSNFYNYLPDVENQKFIVMFATITNISREAITLDALKTKFEFDGYSYDGATYYDDSDVGIWEFIYAINPLESQNVYFIASIPDSIAYELAYMYIGINNDMTVYCYDDIEDMDYYYSVCFQYEG